MHANTYPSRARDYGPGLHAALEHGRNVTPAALAAARKLRAGVAMRIEAMLRTVDCLVCPSMANTARVKEANPYDAETDESWSANVRNDVYAQPFNFSGSPTLSVPCGFSAGGLPISVQFVGRRLGESMLCRVGHAYERATPWRSRHPAV